MNKLTFNPFRIDAYGNVIIPSYMYWRKPLMLFRAGKETLITTTVNLDFEYTGFLYNSHNEKLYWPNFKNFEDIPRYISCVDYEGTPTFAHFTERRVTCDDNRDFFERNKYNCQPLQLEIVKRYFYEMVKITGNVIVWKNVEKKEL